MAVSKEPSAYTVTNCPLMASLMCMPAEICPSNPAGRVSLRMAMKPVIASASKPLSGKGCSLASSGVVWAAALQLI
ncbi:hypothetical protein D3C72_2202580 [compost metagenome]